MIKFTGQSVSGEIRCSHKEPTFEHILWYKRAEEGGHLKMLGFLNTKFAYPEDDVKDRINFDGNGRSDGSLLISNLTENDSAVYFCAARRHSAADPFKAKTKTSCICIYQPEHLQTAPSTTPLNCFDLCGKLWL